MIRISLLHKKVTLGQTCEFEVKKSDPSLEYKVFLKRENIFYIKQMADWNSSNRISLFPEAPGKYMLVLNWRASGNQTGRVEYEFEVISSRELSDTPQLVQVDKKTSFWTPNQWEAQIISNYERDAISQVLRHVRSGWVVYDIGANLGYYSIYLSKAVGNKGRVYCFEANPVCISYLQANLAVNNVKNCEIIPGAILDHYEAVHFTINYSSSGLEGSQKSLFYSSKAGHEIIVHGYDLDQLVEDHGLRIPQFVKMDIEGAEEYAIRGMENILREHQPMMMLEVHGRQAAQNTLPVLEEFGYHFQEMDGSVHRRTDPFLASFPDKVIQLLCLPGN